MKAFLLFRLVDMLLLTAYIALWCWQWMGKLVEKLQHQEDNTT